MAHDMCLDDPPSKKNRRHRGPALPRRSLFPGYVFLWPRRKPPGPQHEAEVLKILQRLLVLAPAAILAPPSAVAVRGAVVRLLRTAHRPIRVHVSAVAGLHSAQKY